MSKFNHIKQHSHHYGTFYTFYKLAGIVGGASDGSIDRTDGGLWLAYEKNVGADGTLVATGKTLEKLDAALTEKYSSLNEGWV